MIKITWFIEKKKSSKNIDTLNLCRNDGIVGLESDQKIVVNYFDPFLWLEYLGF